MVFIHDEGVFDVSIDRIWKYLQDPGAHRHESVLHQEVLEQQGNTMKLRREMKSPMGGKDEEVVRLTLNPPFGFVAEVLDGSKKGSKNAHTYVPMGDKTKVIVAGDFHVHGLDEAATIKATLDYFASVFDEDNATLRQYR